VGEERTVADPTANDSFPASLTDVFEAVLRLQGEWSAQMTPAMQRRGELIRSVGPALVREIVPTGAGFDVKVEGRDGTGLRTRVPWIRVFAADLSPSATGGWYAVYLFAFDGSAVYLSLNQGTTSFTAGQYVPRPADELQESVTWARSVLDRSDTDLQKFTRDIVLGDDQGLGHGYERGNVVALRYEAGQVPTVETLRADLGRVIELLGRVYTAAGTTASRSPGRRSGGQRADRPSLEDVSAFVDWIRSVYGPSLTPTRAASEQAAKEHLDRHAGAMTWEQAVHLGELFNSGEWGGVMRYNRFVPAFVGASMAKVVEPLDEFNRWTADLWRLPVEDVIPLVDRILKDTSAFPGAGRSYPTMLLYLRDPQRFTIWLQITHRGLLAIDRLAAGNERTGGAARYLQYCEAAAAFRAEFDLAPQETDAVLAEIARAADAARTTLAAEIASVVVQGAEEDTGSNPVGTEFPLADVAAATHLPIERLEEWVALLRGPKRQALFYGPPGTGKTFVARQLARHLAGPDGEVELVQFHPSFSYEDFIEGLRPSLSANGVLAYEIRPGVFQEFCQRALGRNGTFVFVIDEVNRAELGAVLGELMMLLEYRGRAVPLPYSQRKFSVPENVVVLATMNTADRSLALVDFALRRRFHAFEMRPDRKVLERHLSARGEPAELALQMFDEVQKRVDNADFAPGHSYWMSDDLSAAGLDRVWRYELFPYLAEYWFEHRETLHGLHARVGEILSEGT
jgi:hypothetical protein